MTKDAFNKKRAFFYQNKGLKIEEETSKMLHLEHFTTACSAGAGCRSSVGRIM
jgi:hypothetical protein